MGYAEFTNVAPYIVGGLSILMLANALVYKILDSKFKDDNKSNNYSRLEESLSIDI